MTRLSILTILILTLCSCDFTSRKISESVKSSTIYCDTGQYRDSFFIELNNLSLERALPFNIRKDAEDGSYFVAVIGTEGKGSIVIIGHPKAIGVGLYLPKKNNIDNKSFISLYESVAALGKKCQNGS